MLRMHCSNDPIVAYPKFIVVIIIVDCLFSTAIPRFPVMIECTSLWLIVRCLLSSLTGSFITFTGGRLVYSAQIRIMSSPLCKLSWQVLVRKELYSGVKCSRVGLYKEGCVMLIVSCAVWLVSVSPVLFYLYKERRKERERARVLTFISG